METRWDFKVVDKPTYQECEQMLKMVQDSFRVKAESIYFFKIFVDFGKIFATYNYKTPICVIQTLKDWSNVSRVQIASFAVHPDYQKREVGTFTAERMIDHLKSEGIKLIGIRITLGHTSMLKIFQKKLGFSILEKLENYYGLGEDRLYLEKTLQYEGGV